MKCYHHGDNRGMMAMTPTTLKSRLECQPKGSMHSRVPSRNTIHNQACFTISSCHRASKQDCSHKHSHHKASDKPDNHRNHVSAGLGFCWEVPGSAELSPVLVGTSEYVGGVFRGFRDKVFVQGLGSSGLYRVWGLGLQAEMATDKLTTSQFQHFCRL